MLRTFSGSVGEFCLRIDKFPIKNKISPAKCRPFCSAQLCYTHVLSLCRPNYVTNRTWMFFEICIFPFSIEPFTLKPQTSEWIFWCRSPNLAFTPASSLHPIMSMGAQYHMEADTKWLLFCRRHFQMTIVYENGCVLMQDSLKFVPNGPISNTPTLVR